MSFVDNLAPPAHMERLTGFAPVRRGWKPPLLLLHQSRESAGEGSSLIALIPRITREWRGAGGGNRTRDSGMAHRRVTTTLRPQVGIRCVRCQSGSGESVPIGCNEMQRSGREDSNLHHPGSKPGCLPLTYTQIHPTTNCATDAGSSGEQGNRTLRPQAATRLADEHLAPMQDGLSITRTTRILLNLEIAYVYDITRVSTSIARSSSLSQSRSGGNRTHVLTD